MEVRPSSAIYETTSVLRTFSYDPASKRFRETTARHEFNTPFSSPEGTLSFADYDLDGDLDLAVSYLGANRWYWFPQTPLHTTVGMLMYGGIFSEILCERGELSRTISENKFPGLSKRVVNDFGSVEQFLDNGGCVMTKPAGLPGVSRSPIFEPFNIPTVLLAFTRGVIHLYENQGGAFVFRGALEAPIEASAHATGAAGTQDWTYLSHRFFQILSIDVTDDGLPDIVAASSDASRNALFINEGQMSFREAGRERGLAVSGTGMGITMNDYRRGGVQHMLVTNFGHIFDFQNRAAGDFEINQALSLNHLGFGWGIASLDVDNDGWTDLYLSNGVRPAATPYESGVSQAMDDPERITMVRNRLYVNKHGNFIDGTEEYVPDLALSSRPVAVGDIDSDGYPDFFVGGVGRPGGRGLYFFHNKGGSNAWVQLRLRGTDSNIDAVGASATIESGESKERKHILLGSSFSSQDSHVLMFGLGDSDAETVPVEVRWPSGNVQHMMVPVNERTEILESQR
jgi:hypothetical protein